MSRFNIARLNKITFIDGDDHEKIKYQEKKKSSKEKITQNLKSQYTQITLTQKKIIDKKKCYMYFQIFILQCEIYSLTCSKFSRVSNYHM